MCVYVWMWKGTWEVIYIYRSISCTLETLFKIFTNNKVGTENVSESYGYVSVLRETERAGQRFEVEIMVTSKNLEPQMTCLIATRVTPRLLHPFLYIPLYKITKL